MEYGAIFVLGGLSALAFNTSLFSRFFSPVSIKQTAISERAASILATIVDGREITRVARVIDGDTIELIDGRHVRYIGIDTPEMGDAYKTLACFATEATEENKNLVEGKTVRLEKDVSETDRYGRLLRNVYVGEGMDQMVHPYVFVNDYLVRQGFARVATFPPDVAHQQEFLQAEQEAREQGRGLWNACNTGNTSKTSKISN